MRSCPPPRCQVVEFDPSALLTPPGDLGARMRRFRSLASGCPEWRREFRCAAAGLDRARCAGGPTRCQRLGPPAVRLTRLASLPARPPPGA
jgi:hypothetical protein